MSETTHIHVRDARDRLLDLLNIGQTFPLQDLKIQDDQLKVAYGTPATITIADSQQGVLYALHALQKQNDDISLNRTSAQAEGTGGELPLKTYSIKDDETFEIVARKLPWYLFRVDLLAGQCITSQKELLDFIEELNKGKLPSPLDSILSQKIGFLLSDNIDIATAETSEDAVWYLKQGGKKKYQMELQDYALYICRFSNNSTRLHATATVKVGLDVSLKAWISDTPHLDPAMTDPKDNSPRIIDYGKSVNVVLPNSQEGVEYTLVYLVDGKEILLSEAVMQDNLHNIYLTSQPIQEDVDIRIRALNGSEDVELLEIILPLRVRANPGVCVSTAASVIDHAGNGAIVLGDDKIQTQQSVWYRLFMRTIPDRDYVHLNRSDWAKVKVELEDGTTVQVRDQVPQGAWSNSEEDGFRPVGKTMRGNGEKISFPVKGLTEDTLFLIQAEKKHHFSSERDSIPSTIRLQQAAVILVRPDPSPALHILTTAQEDGTCLLEVSQGQPGVFYHFRSQPDGPDLAPPAYMHQKNEESNKGIADNTSAAANEGLAVEVDFVPARSLPAETDAGDPATRDPLPPQLLLLDTAPQTELHVYAVKAQTGVGAALADSVTLPTLPKIEPEKPVVAKGVSSKIRVYASKGDERYRLLHHGEPVVVDGAPPDGWYKGTGQNRLLPTGPIMETTTFQVVIRRQNGSIMVDRYLAVQVQVTG